MYICIYVYMYICIHVYMYTCIYVYMYRFAIFFIKSKTIFYLRFVSICVFSQLVWKVGFSIYKIVTVFFCCFNICWYLSHQNFDGREKKSGSSCMFTKAALLLRRVVATKKLRASGFHPTLTPCPCVPVRVATHVWASDTFISPTDFLINEAGLCWTCATLLIQTIFQTPWIWDDIFRFRCIPVAPSKSNINFWFVKVVPDPSCFAKPWPCWVCATFFRPNSETKTHHKQSAGV